MLYTALSCQYCIACFARLVTAACCVAVHVTVTVVVCVRHECTDNACTMRCHVCKQQQYGYSGSSGALSDCSVMYGMATYATQVIHVLYSVFCACSDFCDTAMFVHLSCMYIHCIAVMCDMQ
jgi:hypothetical protein